MLSYLRSPRRVDRRASTDLVGTCSGDGKVEIYDMLHPPGTNTPSMFHGDDVCSDVMLYTCVCQQTWEMSVRLPFLLFWTGRIACNSRQFGRGLHEWATTAGNTNGDVETWYMAPNILLGICMGASSTSFFTRLITVLDNRDGTGRDSGGKNSQRDGTVNFNGVDFHDGRDGKN